MRHTVTGGPALSPASGSFRHVSFSAGAGSGSGGRGRGTQIPLMASGSRSAPTLLGSLMGRHGHAASGTPLQPPRGQSAPQKQRFSLTAFAPDGTAPPRRSGMPTQAPPQSPAPSPQVETASPTEESVGTQFSGQALLRSLTRRALSTAISTPLPIQSEPASTAPVAPGPPVSKVLPPELLKDAPVPASVLELAAALLEMVERTKIIDWSTLPPAVQQLPAFECRAEVIRKLSDSQTHGDRNAWICDGATGCGKSVILPLLVLDLHWRGVAAALRRLLGRDEVASQPPVSFVPQLASKDLISDDAFENAFFRAARLRIYVSQPTRLAARALATFVNDSLPNPLNASSQPPLGLRVGYATSLDTCFSEEHSEIIFATAGFLLGTLPRRLATLSQAASGTLATEDSAAATLDHFQLAFEDAASSSPTDPAPKSATVGSLSSPSKVNVCAFQAHDALLPFTLVIDEAHTVSLEMELLFAWSRIWLRAQGSSEALLTKRRLFVMSASMQPEPLFSFFNGPRGSETCDLEHFHLCLDATPSSQVASGRTFSNTIFFLDELHKLQKHLASASAKDCGDVRNPLQNAGDNVKEAFSRAKSTTIEELFLAVMNDKPNQAISFAAQLAFEFVGEGQNVVIFVPGFDELQRTITRIAALGRATPPAISLREDSAVDEAGTSPATTIIKSGSLVVDVIGLHSTVIGEASAQLRASSARAKIIVTTNVAESSVTIPDVALVINHCTERFPIVMGSATFLKTRLCNWSSIIQRQGRTGRTCHGCTIHLATEADLRNAGQQHLDLAAERPWVSGNDTTRLLLDGKALVAATARSSSALPPQLAGADAVTPRLEFSGLCAGLPVPVNSPAHLIACAAKLRRLGMLSNPVSPPTSPPMVVPPESQYSKEWKEIDSLKLTLKGRFVAFLPLHPGLATFVLHGFLLDCLEHSVLTACGISAGVFALDFPQSTSAAVIASTIESRHSLVPRTCISDPLIICRFVDKWYSTFEKSARDTLLLEFGVSKRTMSRVDELVAITARRLQSMIADAPDGSSNNALQSPQIRRARRQLSRLHSLALRSSLASSNKRRDRLPDDDDELVSENADAGFFVSEDDKLKTAFAAAFFDAIMLGDLPPRGVSRVTSASQASSALPFSTAIQTSENVDTSLCAVKVTLLQGSVEIPNPQRFLSAIDAAAYKEAFSFLFRGSKLTTVLPQRVEALPSRSALLLSSSSSVETDRPRPSGPNASLLDPLPLSRTASLQMTNFQKPAHTDRLKRAPLIATVLNVLNGSHRDLRIRTSVANFSDTSSDPELNVNGERLTGSADDGGVVAEISAFSNSASIRNRIQQQLTGHLSEEEAARHGFSDWYPTPAVIARAEELFAANTLAQAESSGPELRLGNSAAGAGKWDSFIEPSIQNTFLRFGSVDVPNAIRWNTYIEPVVVSAAQDLSRKAEVENDDADRGPDSDPIAAAKEPSPAPVFAPEVCPVCGTTLHTARARTAHLVSRRHIEQLTRFSQLGVSLDVLKRVSAAASAVTPSPVANVPANALSVEVTSGTSFAQRRQGSPGPDSSLVPVPVASIRSSSLALAQVEDPDAFHRSGVPLVAFPSSAAPTVRGTHVICRQSWVLDPSTPKDALLLLFAGIVSSSSTAASHTPLLVMMNASHTRMFGYCFVGRITVRLPTPLPSNIVQALLECYHTAVGATTLGEASGGDSFIATNNAATQSALSRSQLRLREALSVILSSTSLARDHGTTSPAPDDKERHWCTLTSQCASADCAKALKHEAFIQDRVHHGGSADGRKPSSLMWTPTNPIEVTVSKAVVAALYECQVMGRMHVPLPFVLQRILSQLGAAADRLGIGKENGSTNALRLLEAYLRLRGSISIEDVLESLGCVFPTPWEPTVRIPPILATVVSPPNLLPQARAGRFSPQIRPFV